MKRIRRLIDYVRYRYLQTRNRDQAIEDVCNFTPVNVVLKDISEIDQAVANLGSLRLRPHGDKFKNWDVYHMLSFILKHGDRDSVILDMGCANYGILLPSLELYDFTNLYGCDLGVPKDVKKGHIRLSRQDLQKTYYPDAMFDFITSSSVIEHGVDVRSYLKETSRLLRPGGCLLTTTDYWPDPIDTKGLYPYGDMGQMKIFTRDEIEHLFEEAANYGMSLVSPMDFSFRDRVVNWERVNRRFTFIYFVLRKEAKK